MSSEGGILVAKKVATPKQTAVTGIDFENEVCTFYVAKMIAGEAPFGARSERIVAIGFQQRSRGWLFDDIVMNLADSGRVCTVAFSIKSNIQFTKKSAPRDLVKDAWSQFLHVERDVFQRDRDWMGIITCEQTKQTKEALKTLLKLAAGNPGDALAQNIKELGYTSGAVRDLYTSFACPQDLMVSNASGFLQGDLLARFVVREFDFDSSSSQSTATAVEICRAMLRSGDTTEAAKLWDSLCKYVGEKRGAGSCEVTREEVLKEFVPKYDFLEFPDYRGDWQSILKWSEDRINGIPDSIGGVLRLDKAEQRDKLRKRLDEAAAVVVLGDSGAGKTVLAKRCCEGRQTIWLPAERFSEEVAISGLVHPLNDVIRNATACGTAVVIDRLERLSCKDDFSRMAAFLAAMPKGNGWVLLATCRADQWQRIAFRLASYPEVPEWNAHYLELLTDGELGSVCQKFRQIAPLVGRNELRPLVRNPKMLDVLARRLRTGKEAKSWLGETDLVDWLWDEMSGLADGEGLVLGVERLAAQQADERRFNTPRMRLASETATKLALLKSEEFCVEEDGQISFKHDIFGDWARYRVLLAHRTEVAKFLDGRLDNPFWHRAIRLYASRLLEDANGRDEWVQVVGANSQTALEDCFLDAITFAANPYEVLGRVGACLLAEECHLLKRFLNRFLIIASIPNNALLELYAQLPEDIKLHARMQNRIPLWRYWPPVITFVHRNLKTIIGEISSELSAIVTGWLFYNVPNDHPLKKECAEIALALGTAALADGRVRGYRRRDRVGTQMYEAMLLAFPELPNAIETVARKAAGLLPLDDSEKADARWPGGPAYKVDDDFRQACLFKSAFNKVIQIRPALAAEIISALLISDRAEEAGWGRPDKALGLVDIDGFHTSGFHTGPFLTFLRIDAAHALDMIIHIVDIGSQTHGLPALSEMPDKADVETANGVRVFTGGGSVYWWHSGHAFCPDSAIAALMALEKYLYLKIDASQSVDDICSTILDKATSVAFLGLLCTVGKYKSDLFTTVLRPLLTVPEIYHWESEAIRWGSGAGNIRYGFEPIEVCKSMQEWYAMAHRKTEFSGIAISLFLSAETYQDASDKMKASIQDGIGHGSVDGAFRITCDKLLTWFDRANWRRQDDGRCVYSEPAHLAEQYRVAREDAKKGMFVVNFPFLCRDKLNEGKAISQEQSEAWFDVVKELDDMLSSEDDSEYRDSLYNGIAGGIAVLGRCCREWLAANPKKKAWCVRRMRAFTESPPAPDPINIPYALGDFFWDYFLSEAVPAFWAEEPESPQLRKMVAELVCLRHYSSLNALLRSAFAVREKLGTSFYQLIHLVLLHATHGNSLYGWFHTAGASDGEKGKKATRTIHAAKRKLISGSLSTDVVGWADEVIASGEWNAFVPEQRGIDLSRYYNLEGIRQTSKPELWRLHLEMDCHLLETAFCGIFEPNEARSVAELERWRGFWVAILKARLSEMQVYNQQHEVVYDDDYECNPVGTNARGLLTEVSKFIVETKSTKLACDLWKPIMELGPSCHYYVGTFALELIMEVLRGGKGESFIPTWRAILEYFQDSDLWARNNGDAYHVSEVWANLLGMCRYGDVLAAPAHAHLVKKLEPYYAEYAKERLPHDSASAAYFMYFLQKGAAADIQLSGLVWMSQVAASASSYWWDEYVVEALAGLLVNSWHQHGNKIKENGEFDVAFRKLLQALVDKQNPRALDLQQTIAQSK